MTIDTEIQKEREKLAELFKDIEPAKAMLVDGLIEDAAFLRVQNARLKARLAETGMVKIHPDYPDMQKPIEAARQYLRNVNSYAVVIKTLNGVLSKNVPDEEDEFDRFLKEHQQHD